MHKPPRRCVVLQREWNAILTSWCTPVVAAARRGSLFKPGEKNPMFPCHRVETLAFLCSSTIYDRSGLREDLLEDPPLPIACDFGSRRLDACSPRLNKRPRTMNRLSRHMKEENISYKIFFQLQLQIAREITISYQLFMFRAIIVCRHRSSIVITLLHIYRVARFNIRYR